MSDPPISRRDLFVRSRDVGGLAAFATLLACQAEAKGEGRADEAAGAQGPGAARPGAPDVYTSIGVRPFINARGTYTILSGSTMLPEVRAAMDQASRQYVHLDELTEAIGQRLAALTSAEWGLVTSGCAAALTHATAACVAGGNPDLHVRIPDLRGFPKDEVVIPKHSRNVYDAAIRAVGVRVVEASTLEEFDAALGPRTAMVYVLAGPEADRSELNVAALAPLTRPRGVPILVDAAAEILTIPNVHLQNGATLVGYSGGKCLRGPQTAGLLLGRKDLLKAAWVHSAPHHGFGRAMKVGKEEAVGMLAAVEQWVRRDHDAEWARWTSWLDLIANRVKSVTAIGLTIEIVQPAGLSNRTPTLRILWDRTKLPVPGSLVAQWLFDPEQAAGQHRISLFPARGEDDNRTGVSITPYMLAPGDAEIIAERLYRVLSGTDVHDHRPPPAAPLADLTGTWTVRINYAASQATHVLRLRQRDNTIDGSHQGDFISRELTGTIDARELNLQSTYGEEHGDALNYRFNGTVDGDTMTGTLDMGEYLKATWSASRRERSS
jgi:L-seryl-tRNA(Ser) seleniumtransferase